MQKLYIVMPAYNEEANIEKVVEEWHPVVEKIGNGSRLVIVDDGSKDATFAKLQNLTKEYSCLEPITKPNSGHGSTLLFAYSYALDKGANFIFQTDSDGQTVAREFWDFWDLRVKYDFIIGSRKARMDGLSRVFVTKVLKFVIWFIFGIWVDDVNTPFRLMNAEKLKSLLKIVPKDFFLSNVLISVLVVLKKQRYLWRPITFRPRQGGVNSINLKRIIKIGIKAIADFKKIKALIK